MRLEVAKYLYDVQSAAFRNILIHGYADVDDALVWDIVHTRLEPLRRQVDALLRGDA